jgi:outer membrane lipoprotein-sorting protein
MKRLTTIFACAAAGLVAICGSALANPVDDALAKFSAAWGGIKTYECTLTVHEVRGRSVQDRVYHLKFSKPLNTRVDIVGGDGRGSAAVWSGGDRVRGHQGGLLAIIKLNLDIHSRLATSLRGSTIAQANWGSLLTHLRSLKVRDIRIVRQKGQRTELLTRLNARAPNEDLIKEMYVLGSDGLPLEYFQYGENDAVLKHVVYSDVRVNVDLPASSFSL